MRNPMSKYEAMQQLYEAVGTRSLECCLDESISHADP